MTIEMHEMSQEEEDRLWDIVDSYTTNKTKPTDMNEYDAHIAQLTKSPQRMLSEWTSARGLFKMVSGAGTSYAACPIMLRNNYQTVATGNVTEEIIAEIRKDERLPKKAEELTLAHLPILKEWQERIDKLKNA